MSTKPLGMTEAAFDAAESDFREFITDLSNEELNTIVKTHAKLHSISEEEARAHRDSFLRFMALAKLTGRSLSPDKDSDSFWHSFLTHTRAYADFCQKHFGTFIHHEPRTKNPNRVGPPDETSRLFWEAFNARANCNNTCDADWMTAS